ncbi:MAG TPA: MarR family winged helix-turn-helix transcriptional regulator [Mycobacteriales bacterium]|nr:MarR family winged helix-turn-helix transcriptional regulator [Mycobacteriales bacterium]
MTRWLTDDEQRMWRGWLDMHAAVGQATSEQLAEHGLSEADWALLVPLSEGPADGLRARDLGRVVGWDRSRVSHQLRRMEARGLVERLDCPTDARGTVVRLTAQGRRLVEAAAPGHVETVRRVFVDLVDADELALLTDVARRVREAAGDPPCGRD